MDKSFTPEETLYGHDEFSVAYGTWTVDGVKTKRLACRWTTFPFNRAHQPAWLVLPTNLYMSFLVSLLLQNEGVNKEAIEKAMSNSSNLWKG